jgi:hypothetical protein
MGRAISAINLNSQAALSLIGQNDLGHDDDRRTI